MARNRIIDLFSDTKSKPTAGMRKAIAEAEVGDEQKGEDPTTRALEERVAALLGHAAAVLMPSGTMCNQIALAVHTTAGDEIIAARSSHILSYEGGGGAVLSRHQSSAIDTATGMFTGRDVEALLRTPSRYHPRSRLVAVEQTTNLGGGGVWPLAQLEEVSRVARSAGLIVHMDGARLPNAAVAAGIPASRMTTLCDSAWLDLSKGLGCPIGAVLVGSKSFIEQAWQWKQRIGGAMRQSGIIAAAGIYALDHHWDRLAEDHANARRLAEIAGNVKGITIANPDVATNLLFMDVSNTGVAPAELEARLKAKGVTMGYGYGRKLRAVTHIDISRDDIEAAGKALADAIAGR